MIHLRYLHAMTTGNTALLMTALGVAVVLPAALLTLVRRTVQPTSSAAKQPEPSRTPLAKRGPNGS